MVSGGCQTLKSGRTTSYFLTGKQREEALLHLPWDLHRVESFGLQPGFHILRGGVVGDVHHWDVWPRHVEFPLCSAPADGEPVNQLILHLLHLGFPAYRDRDGTRLILKVALSKPSQFLYVTLNHKNSFFFL